MIVENNIFDESTNIRNLATDILHKYKLEEVLKHYGIVYVFGSYSLDLMIWKDLDISIQVDSIDIESIFKLMQDVAIMLDPGEVKYTNYDYIPSTHGSEGIYIQVKDSHIGSSTWDKIDIRIGDAKQVSLQLERNKFWKDIILGNHRKPILQIKKEMFNNSMYRKQIQSVDIYEAVIKDKIFDYETFKIWCKDKKGVQI